MVARSTPADVVPTKHEGKLIEKFQCPGCCAGSDMKCGAFKLSKGYGVSCLGHAPGTFIIGGGTFALGLPKGFDKVGQSQERDEADPYIRIWVKGTAPTWNKFNIPVWALEEEGFLFVRTYCPRINTAYVDIVEGGKLSAVKGAVDVAPFKGEID